MPLFTLVIPTSNEKKNLLTLLESIKKALDGLSWEVIVVDDDSADGTAHWMREQAQEDLRIRILHRVGRRGLSSACIEGILASSSPYVAIMDADHQHDVTLLPQMLKKLQHSSLDLVIGSRYIAGGSASGLQGMRTEMSTIASCLARWTLHTQVSDPMSGFFMMTRPFFHQTLPLLTGVGFKLLLDLFASSPRPVTFEELPYQMQSRLHGASKLDLLVIWEYLFLIGDKTIGRWIPIRFVLFALVGLTGVGVHLGVLLLVRSLFLIPFSGAQLVATFTAMTSNFLMNNRFTYQDVRLKGKKFWVGLLGFYLACSVGVLINLEIADFLYTHRISWWFAGLLGAMVGAVWNYGFSQQLSWKRSK